MSVKYLLKVEGRVFGENELSCLGNQLAQIAKDTGEFFKNQINWYATDVDAYQTLPQSLEAKICPRFVGSVSYFVEEVQKIDQFLSGVFFATQKKTLKPNFRHTPDTEDDPFDELGDAVLEIRAYDTAFFSIHTIDSMYIKFIANKYSILELVRCQTRN